MSKSTDKIMEITVRLLLESGVGFRDLEGLADGISTIVNFDKTKNVAAQKRALSDFCENLELEN